MNRPLTTLLLVLGFWGTTLLAQAQVRFSIGPRVGYNLSTARFTHDEHFQTSYRSGLEAGLTACLRVGHVALQPAIVYAQKGYRLAFTVPGDRVFEALYYRDNTRLNYLTFPLSLAYSQRPDGQGWQVFAGPYLGLLLSGRYTSNIAYDYGYTGAPGPGHESTGRVASERDYDPNDHSTAHTKGVDAGLQGGLGYHHHRLLLQATYSVGLRNVQYKNFAANVGFGTSGDVIPYYNRAFQLSLAYLFGPKDQFSK